MTLLGKIFTVLIFIMSLVFMAFTVMTYAAHKNWKQLVMNPTTTEEMPRGLKFQIEDALRINIGLREDIDEKEKIINEERVARQKALAGLHTKLVNIQISLDDAREKNGRLEATNTELAQNLTEAETQRKNLLEQNVKLVDEIKIARDERELRRKQVIELADHFARLDSKHRELQERRNQLAQQVAAREKVMREYGLTVHSLTERHPPILYGNVTEVSKRNNKFVEISLGTDDGLRMGHQLDAYRDRSYLGRIVVRKITHNKAVGEVVFLKSPIKKDDRVTTKLINRST